MQGGEEARSEAYLVVRCNDERRSQRRRWAFFNSLLTKNANQRVHDLWERDHEREANELERDERDDSPVDVNGRDLRRCDPTEIEERKSKGRREKRGLEVHRNQHTQ